MVVRLSTDHGGYVEISLVSSRKIGSATTVPNCNEKKKTNSKPEKKKTALIPNKNKTILVLFCFF